MKDTRVRPSTREDSAAIAKLLTQLGYPVTAPEIPERLERLLGHPGTAAFIAERLGEIIGFATVHVFPAIHSTAPIAMLTALVVAEGARGEGAGRKLVEAAEALGCREGCSQILVTTAEPRIGAHAFYARMGWEHTGRRFAKRLG